MSRRFRAIARTTQKIILADASIRSPDHEI